jgi:hypothetical protein
MFGWFHPVCPCDPAAKKWVEDRLRWLVKQFGLHVLLERPIILPTEEFFPDPWDGTPKAARRMFHRVCEYMGVDRDDVELKFFDDATPSTMIHLDPTRGFAAGTWSAGEEPWQQGVIRLEKGSLDCPADLVGIMAHELSHQRLLGEGRIMRSTYDNELLTDLTAVYHGFGIFLANNPRKSTGELKHWPGTELHRPEYLSEPMLGYALALIAWFRDEDWPDWAKHLRWAPRAVFKQGLRYLQKTADSSFKPVRLRLVGDEEE